MKKLTEEDIKYRYITPAIEESGWKKEQVFMEYFFTDGQVLVRGNMDWQHFSGQIFRGVIA